MEIILGIVVFIVAIYLYGRLKGPPDPTTSTDAMLQMHLQSHRTWVNKYLRLPLEQQRSPSLTKMHEVKTRYIKQVEAELLNRQLARGVGTAISQELPPILDKAAELQKVGLSPQEALKTALGEWKNNAPNVVQDSVSQAGHADIAYGLTVADRAMQGNVEAQYLVGVKLLSDFGQRAQGIEMLKKASDQGFTQAGFELGCYLLGRAKSEDEFKEVVALLSSAAENWHGKAAYYLSKMFEEGLGVEKNLDEAHKWASRLPDNIGQGFLYRSQYGQAESEFASMKMRRSMRGQ